MRYIIFSSGIQYKCSDPLGNARIEGVTKWKCAFCIVELDDAPATVQQSNWSLAKILIFGQEKTNKNKTPKRWQTCQKNLKKETVIPLGACLSPPTLLRIKSRPKSWDGLFLSFWPTFGKKRFLFLIFGPVVSEQSPSGVSLLSLLFLLLFLKILS